MAGLLFWKPPWERGGICFPKGQPDRVRHVFVDELRGRELDLRRFGGAFDVLTDARLAEYQSALPAEWLQDGGDIGQILAYVRALKKNVDLAISNVSEALR
jgi:hypothetical protein